MEALALAERPLTAYRVAKSYNLNVAKVYFEMNRLRSLGLVRRSPWGRVARYVLEDDDLRRLALKLSSRVQTYASWRSDASRRARFRMGYALVPRFTLDAEPRAVASGERRMSGELENLASLGRKKFDSKYRRRSDRTFDRI